MKTFAKSLLMVMVVALCVVAAQAQSSVLLKGTVPINFMIGDRSLPAGEYTVRAVSHEVEAWYDQNGRGLFMVSTLPMGKEADLSTYKLVFYRYGDTYFLREVWSGGISHEVNAGPREQRIAKTHQREVVAVLMTR
jgi:hypothetical protein